MGHYITSYNYPQSQVHLLDFGYDYVIIPVLYGQHSVEAVGIKSFPVEAFVGDFTFQEIANIILHSLLAE